MVLMSIEETMLMKLEALSDEHRLLNLEVDRLAADPMSSPLTVRRLKKRKLALRDEMERIRDRLRPDIIA